MKLFLTLVAIAALASAKPVEKTKRQFQFYPQTQISGRQFDFNSAFAQPEITNDGSSGLANSNNLISTSAGSDLSSLNNIATSTIAPEILNGNFASTPATLIGSGYVQAGNAAPTELFGSAASVPVTSEQILTRNLVASSPISGANEQVFKVNFASNPSTLIGNQQVLSGASFGSTPSPLIGSEQVFASTPSPLIGSEQIFASTPSPLIGSEQVFAGNFASTPSPVIISGSTPSTLIGSGQIVGGLASSTVSPANIGTSGIAASSRSFSSNPFNAVNIDSIQSRSYDDFNNYNNYFGQVQSYGKSNEVTKNVYFYEAPEELEPIRPRKIVQVPQVKTNYKLLFIKAPSVPEPQPIEIPANLYQNEKTRVYVLVKKPKVEQEVKVVAGPTPKPEKPEVFYIKYNTKEEAEKAIKDAEAGIESGKEFLSVESGKQLINNIKDNKKVSFETSFNQIGGVRGGFESSTVLPSSVLGFNQNQFGGLKGGFESSTVLPSSILGFSQNQFGGLKGGFESSSVVPSSVLGFNQFGGIKTFESSTAAPFIASTTFQPFIESSNVVNSNLYKNNPFLNSYSPAVFSPKFAGFNTFSSYPAATLGSTGFYGNQFDLRSGKNLDESKLSVKDEPVQVRVIGGSLDKTSTQTPSIFTNSVNDVEKSTTEAAEIDSTTVSE